MPSVSRRKESKKPAPKAESDDDIQESVLDEFKAEFGCEDVEAVLSDDASLSGEEEEEDDGVVISFQDESGSEAESEEKAASESEEEQEEPKEVLPLKLDAKTEEKMKRKMKGARAARNDEEKGVVYLARIPHGLSKYK
jgi:hypothetical protein